MCISGIYSLADEVNKTESGVSTSGVDIDIKEYNQNNELFSEYGKVVMPGDEIILIPRVSNLGVDCYIRAKFTYTINNENFDVPSYIDGDYSSWTKKEDYYYYDSVFTRNSSVDLFNHIVIPGNLSSNYQGKTVTVRAIVDAIQAKNFDGDWSNKEIKESITRTYNIDYNGESSIIYDDNSSQHITLDNDFFNNLGNLLPGDRISKKIVIHNKSEEEHEYFLSIEHEGLTSEELELLKNIKLNIKNSSGTSLVSSNLGVKGKYGLGKYPQNDRDELTIELSLPIDVDNECSKLFTKIIWRFSLDDYEEDPIVEPDDNNHYENPITGDLKFDLSFTIFILSTLGFIVVLILEKINDEKKEKN